MALFSWSSLGILCGPLEKARKIIKVIQLCKMSGVKFGGQRKTKTLKFILVISKTTLPTLLVTN